MDFQVEKSGKISSSTWKMVLAIADIKCLPDIQWVEFELQF